MYKLLFMEEVLPVDPPVGRDKSVKTYILFFFVLFFGLIILLLLIYLHNKDRIAEKAVTEGTKSSEAENNALKTNAYLYNDEGGNIQVSAEFLLIDVDYEKDLLQPDFAKRLKVGFNDNNGNPHIYPARIGDAMSNGGTVGVSYCMNTDVAKVECSVRNPSEVVEELKTYKNQKLIGFFQIEVSSVCENLACQAVKKQHFFLNELSRALLSGNGFPDRLDEDVYALQIVQLNVSSISPK